MVIYRPGRFHGVVRYQGGPWDGQSVSVPWPLPAGNIEPLTDVGVEEPGSYRLVEHTEIPPLTADYRWEPSE